jgi:hypothetical protein
MSNKPFTFRGETFRFNLKDNMERGLISNIALQGMNFFPLAAQSYPRIMTTDLCIYVLTLLYKTTTDKLEKDQVKQTLNKYHKIQEKENAAPIRDTRR